MAHTQMKTVVPAITQDMPTAIPTVTHRVVVFVPAVHFRVGGRGCQARGRGVERGLRRHDNGGAGRCQCHG